MAYADNVSQDAKEALRELIPDIKDMVRNTNLRAEDRLHAAHILVSIASQLEESS